jgi:transposase-like protein
MVMDGMSASQVSQKLGVSEGLLYKWKQRQVEALQDSHSAIDAQALVAENQQLRKQLQRAEKINEILKKRWGTLRRRNVRCDTSHEVSSDQDTGVFDRD